MVELLWVPFSEWCVKSTDGHYSVTKAGPNFARTYSAWYAPVPQNRWAPGVLLDVFRDGTEADMRKAAKQACQRHAAQRLEKLASAVAAQ